MSRLQSAFMLDDAGYKYLKKACVACTLTNFSMMLSLFVMMQMLIEIIRPLTGGEISWNKMWLLFVLGIAVCYVIFLCHKNDYKKTYTNSYTQSENRRLALAEHIRRLPMSMFNNKDLADLTTNLMGDANALEHSLSHVLPQLLANFIFSAVICVMMTAYDWRMAFAMFITVPLSFGIIIFSRGIYGRLQKKHMSAKLAASVQVQEYIEGIKVIRACNLDGEKFDALEQALRVMKRLAIAMEFGAGVFVSGAQVILQAGIGLIVLLGTTLLTGGRLELIPMLTFTVVAVRIYAPFLVQLTLLPELLYFHIAVKRMRDMMALQPMEGNENIEINDFGIVFDHVGFNYNEDGRETIPDMSVEIPAGGITALVGPSGSGKSTLARLIARFWDVNKGRIVIGGTDVKDIDPERLMGYMSFVFQDVVLFNDTIYDNIRIGNMSASREEVLAAAEAACCGEFVERLPNGYDTVLGENGATLSGGERQRISIARALLKDAPIVLLDEATSSLDPENEVLIQRAISKLIAGKTVVVIAHRLRTISEADKIIVLDSGRIAEQGTHEELLERGGLYNKLFTLQQASLGWSAGT